MQDQDYYAMDPRAVFDLNVLSTLSNGLQKKHISKLQFRKEVVAELNKILTLVEVSTQKQFVVELMPDDMLCLHEHIGLLKLKLPLFDIWLQFSKKIDVDACKLKFITCSNTNEIVQRLQAMTEPRVFMQPTIAKIQKRNNLLKTMRVLPSFLRRRKAQF